MYSVRSTCIDSSLHCLNTLNRLHKGDTWSSQRRLGKEGAAEKTTAPCLRPWSWDLVASELQKSEGCFLLRFLCVDSIVAVQSTTLCKIWKMQTYPGQLRKSMVWPSGTAWCPSMQHCAMTSFVPLGRLLWWTSDEVCEGWQVMKLRHGAYSWYALQPMDRQYWRPTFFAVRWRWMKFCCSWCGWWGKKLECQDTIVENNVAITMWLFFRWLRSWMIDDQYRLISLVFHC